MEFETPVTVLSNSPTSGPERAGSVQVAHLFFDRDGAWNRDVSGVGGCDRLDKDDAHFLLRDRIVPHSAWCAVELARAQFYVLLSFDFDAQVSRDHEGHLVFIVVRMPDEFSEKLCNVDVLVIDLPHDPRGPMLLHLVEFCGDVRNTKFCHATSLSQNTADGVVVCSPKALSGRRVSACLGHLSACPRVGSLIGAS